MDTFLIASIVNFVAVLAILVKFGGKPALDFMKSRSESIRNFIADAEKEFEASKSELNLWDQKWRNAEAEAKQHLAGAKQSIETLRAQTLKEAEHQAKRIQEEGKLLGNSEYRRARSQLQREVVELSVQTAAKHLKVSLSEPDRQNLISEFLETVHG